MRRKFIGALLFGALLVAPTSTFVSCSDYDDEIDNLQAQINANKSEMGTLVSDKITAVEAVIANLEAADASIEAQLADLEEADAATMAAAQSLVQAAAQELMGSMKAVVAMVEGNTASIADLVAADAKLTTAIETAQAKADAAYTLAQAADAKAAEALATLATVKADLEAQVTALDAKLVAELEKLAEVDAAVKAQIAALEAAGETVNGELAKLAKAIEDQKTALTKVINEAVAKVQAEVDGLETTVANLQKSFNTASAALQNEINTVKTGVQNVVASVDALAAEMEILGMLLRAELKSMVFEPQYYYHGIEAMAAVSYNFESKSTYAVNPDDDFSTDAPYDFVAKKVMPVLSATYHLNPSNAAVDTEDASKFNFVVLDRNYVKATGETFAPVVESASVEGGMLTVLANVPNAEEIKDIEADGQVTVLALQYNKGVAAEAEDTVITSDYAAVRAVEYKDLVLNFAGTTCTHLYTTAAEAIQNDPQVEIVWNDNDGLDLDELVNTHFDDNTGAHQSLDAMAADGTAAKLGFVYSYDLVGWHDGANATSETAHLGYNTENNRVRAQMPKDGKWQSSFEADQNKASIGRQPLVRVTLTYTKGGVNYKAAVGYIKFVIVEEATTPTPAEPKYVTVQFPYWNDAYTVNCGGEVFKNKLTWWQVEEKILALVNMSKEVFEATYELDGTSYVFNKYATDGLTPTTPLLPAGVVEQTKVDVDGHETEVILWTLTNNEAYEIFKQANSVTVYVRYQLKAGMRAKNDYVYVALTWTPSAINITPVAQIANESKIKEYWYAKNSIEAGSGYSDVHINVEVPGQQNSDCEFTTDLKNTFVKNELPAISGLAEVYEHLAATGVGQIKTVFVEETALYTNVPGASGQLYNLYVSADGSKLLTGVDVEVASITADGVITVAQTAEAKDLLNNEIHNKLGDKETLTAKVGFAYTTCAPVNTVALENNTFYVKILRPVSVTEGTAEFEDAQTNGSRALVHFEFIDWRDHKFVNNDLIGSNYYRYYGLNSGAYVSIDPDMDNITTNMNNGTLGVTKLSDVTSLIRFDYEWDSSKYIKDHYFGELVYENNGSTVGNFKIQIPVKVHYTWGTIYTNIVAEVKKTINNANKK